MPSRSANLRPEIDATKSIETGSCKGKERVTSPAAGGVADDVDLLEEVICIEDGRVLNEGEHLRIVDDD